MVEVVGAIGQTIGAAAKAAMPSIVRVPSVAAGGAVRGAGVGIRAGQEAARGFSALKELGTLTNRLRRIPNNRLPFITRADKFAASGESHKALSFLAFGNRPNGFMERLAGGLKERTLRNDLLFLEKIGPASAKGLTREIAGMHIPKNVLDDPVFAQQFSDAFSKEVTDKKAEMKAGTLTPEQYLQGRGDMLRASARNALGRRGENATANDLEELKRKAAMDAIRIQMNLWRQSVMLDKRLTPVAKQRAFVRIERLEKRLLLKESVRWDGLSVVTMLALAASFMQEMVD